VVGLEHDDAASARILASPEGAEHGSGVEREELTETFAEGNDRSTIRPGVGEQEDHVTLGIVSDLQREPTLDGLPIRHASLGLDATTPRGGRTPADVRIPGAEVAIDRERDLGSPPQAGMELGPESLEQRKLGSVANRVPGRVRAQGEVKPDDGTPGTELLDRDAVELASLEPQELLVRCAGGAGHDPETQAGSDAGLPMLLAGTTDRLAKASTSTIGGPFSSSHVEDPDARPFTGNFWASTCTWSASRTNGPTSRANGPRKSRSAVSWSASRTKRRRSRHADRPRAMPAVPWSGTRTMGNAGRGDSGRGDTGRGDTGGHEGRARGDHARRSRP
jgi:hypothetical protein